MNYLLDTHVLLDLLHAPNRVGRDVRALLEDPLNGVAASAASAWEIAIKAALGRLRTPDGIEAELTREGISTLDITVSDALRAGALPPHHNDPFDRMLVAQALSHGMTLVTRDVVLRSYEVRVLSP